MKRRFSSDAKPDSTTTPCKKRRHQLLTRLPSPPASTPSPQRHTKRTHREQETGPPDPDVDPLRPPRFWDNLRPRIPLVKAALRELDRRNRQTTTTSSPTTRPSPSNIQDTYCDIERFARQGGPDLSALLNGAARAMPPRATTRSRGTRGRVQKSQRGGRRTSSSQASSSQTRTSSLYDAAFKQHLINYKVWPIGHYLETGQPPQAPDNLQDIISFINGGRSSLQPESFTDDNFATFQKSFHLATSEEARSRTLEAIEGPELSISSRHIKRGPVKLSNLRPLLPENFVPGNPDRVYGSRPETLDRGIYTCNQLDTLILPTAQKDIACPNLVVHVKGPGGSQETANVQAVYDGALAARGMEALHMVDQEEDGSRAPDARHVARTLTCTFAAGVLRMHAVHIRRHSPQDVEYITSAVGVWIMDYNVDDFRRGATAYRNAIEWARRQREETIGFANRRAAMSAAASERASSSSVDPIA